MFDPGGRAHDHLRKTLGSPSRCLAVLSGAFVLVGLSLPASGQSGEVQLWSYDAAGAHMLFGGGAVDGVDQMFNQTGTLGAGSYGFFLNIARQASPPAGSTGSVRMDSVSSWDLELGAAAQTSPGTDPYHSLIVSATGSPGGQATSRLIDFTQRFVDSGSPQLPAGAFSTQVKSHLGGPAATADVSIHLAASSRAGAQAAASATASLSWLFQLNVPTGYSLSGHANNVALASDGAGPGSSQFNPIAPTTSASHAWGFTGGTSGQYFGPPAAYGFRYAMSGGSKFTAIQDFPVGFSDAFTVSVGDRVLGTFAPGQKVDFAALTGGGVSAFTLTRITPQADPDPALGFPLRLAFDTATATFRASALAQLLGDATFDGKVDFADLIVLAQHYNTPPGTAIWADGDFNGDGNVDFADLVSLAQNYSAAASAPVPGATPAFQADLAAAFAQVPEPATLLPLGVAILHLVSRRRSRARCAPLSKNPTRPAKKSKTISTPSPRQFPRL